MADEADSFEITIAQATVLDRRLAQHRLDPSGCGILDELAAELGVRL